MIKEYLIVICFLIMIMPVNLLAQENEEEIKKYVPSSGIEYIIKVSKKYATQEGKNIEKYYIQSIKYDTTEKKWSIFFEVQGIPVPGSCFSVTVDNVPEKFALFLCE